MFHKHKWKIVAAAPTLVYGDGWGYMTKLPTKSYTRLALKCDCGDVRTKKINGNFTLEELNRES